MRFLSIELKKKDEFKIKKQEAFGKPQFVYNFPKNSIVVQRDEDALGGWREVTKYSWQQRLIEDDITLSSRYLGKFQKLALTSSERAALTKQISEFFANNPRYSYLVLLWEKKI